MKKYIFPVLYSLCIMLVGTLISSILYYFNVTSDKLNTILLYCISILAIFIGALKLAKEVKYKGIVTGLIYFTCFFVAMVFLSLIIFKVNLGIKNIIYYLILLIFSLLGGILGKNLNEKTDVN